MKIYCETGKGGCCHTRCAEKVYVICHGIQSCPQYDADDRFVLSLVTVGNQQLPGYHLCCSDPSFYGYVASFKAPEKFRILVSQTKVADRENFINI
jgi:hypothetical protein